MNINRKFIIILGVSTLLIITIFGFKAYYQERISQTIPTLPEDISFKKTFNQNYPISFEEVGFFQTACAFTVTPGMINAEKRSREIFCIFGKNEKDNKDKYIFLRLDREVIENFYKGQYIGIAVNYSDLLEKNDSFTLPEGSFNLCSITNPALIEPFREQLLLKDQVNLNSNIVFPEGEVFCSKFFGLPDETLNLLITGFVPQTDLFQAKIYLISEDKTVNDIFSQESFTNIEEILQSYHLLWDVEKPII